MAIDKEKVPDDYYIRLIELMGKEKAEQFLNENDYNFKEIAWKISWLEFIRYLRKKPGKAILIIAPVLYLLMRIVWSFIIQPIFF